MESPKKIFQCMSYCTTDGVSSATPNDSSKPGKSGNTESTDGSNGAQGKQSLPLDHILAMPLDNQ